VILDTWEEESKRIVVQGQPRKKVKKTPSQPICLAWYFMLVIPAMWETIGRGSQSKAGTR
jgi:hypothetical protein